MRVRTGLLILLALGVLAAEVSAVDLGLSAGAASNSEVRWANDAGLWTSAGASAGASLTEEVYANLDVTAQLDVLNVDHTVLEALATANLYTEAGNVGLLAAWSQRGPLGRPEVGLYANTSLPLQGDLVTADLAVVAKTDLAGWYGEVRLGPSLYLPLSQPVMLSLTALGQSMAGYVGLGVPAFSTLSGQFQATVSLSSSWTWGATVGGTWVALGPATSPFAYASTRVSWSYGD